MSNFDEVVGLLPIVDRVARDASFTHGVDESEAYGLLALELVERAKDYLILHGEGKASLIERRLKDEVAAYVRGERLKRMVETEQYFYDPEYVRLFLPFFFAYQDWPNGPVNDDHVSEYPTTEAYDTAIDIKDAWPRLRDWQTEVINERHLSRPTEDGAPDWTGIADRTGRASGPAAEKAYSRATRELTYEMNNSRDRRTREHEGPGAREAISNAKANTTISSHL